MIPRAESNASDNVLGAVFMTVSMASFAFNDAFVKIATAEISPSQVMLVRGAMAALLLYAIAAWRNATVPPSVAFHPGVLLRTLADVGATITYITALQHMPLAKASAIFQALPLTVTLGAALFLGETVGWRRWSAIGVGAIGVLVIVRPGSDGFTVYSVAVLVSVLCAAVRDLVTRRMPAKIPNLFVAFVTAVGTIVCGGLLLPLSGGWVPMGGSTLLSLLAATVAIAIGYVFIVKSMRVGDMGFVAPFRYTVLVIAFVLGTVVFSEPPGIYEIVGSMIVVTSGVYMIYRERRRRQVKTLNAQVH